MPSLASDSEAKSVASCVDLQNTLTAVLSARDWEEVARRAPDFVTQCRNVIKPRYLGSALAFAAMAAAKQNEHARALSIAEDCIKRFYATSDCHVQRVAALSKLGRKDDARKKANIATNLIRHTIALTERALNDYADGIEREVLESELEADRASLALLLDIIEYDLD